MILRLLRHLVMGVMLFCSTFMMGCKHKKPNLAGDAPVKVNDFIAAFQPLALPLTILDTSINTYADTVNISPKVLAQFVPDSIFKQFVHLDAKFAIHPSGRIEKETENYLLLNISQKKKAQIVLLVFDKKNKFLGAKSMLTNDKADGYFYSLSINKEPTFTISKEWINPQTKQLQFSRVGWVYNTAGIFMVVVNDTNEDPTKVDLILNPIDTFPKKNPLSGEYETNKRNFITIRDGKDSKHYLFFIHFEKKEGKCIGELKGTLELNSPTTGIYNQGGDPCIIDFSFENNQVKLKEKGSCGNRRGMECFFNDSFTKKKVAAPHIKPKPKK